MGGATKSGEAGRHQADQNGAAGRMKNHVGNYMPMNEKEFKKRDAKRDLGVELLESVHQMEAGRAGKIYKVTVPPIVSARMKSGLSRTAFAKLLGVSVRTLQDWEQGRREPSVAAQTLIAVAECRSEVLREAIA